MVAGVCGGLGEYFEVDPVLVRVAFVALALLNGAGAILYLILAVVIPNEPEEQVATGAAPQEPAAPRDVAESARAAVEDIAEGVKRQISAEPPTGPGLRSPRALFGLALVLVGLYFLVQQFLPWFVIRWDLVWPFVLIAIGLLIILKPTRGA